MMIMSSFDKLNQKLNSGVAVQDSTSYDIEDLLIDIIDEEIAYNDFHEEWEMDEQTREFFRQIEIELAKIG